MIWNIQKVNPPWRDRPSIYQHILENIRAGEPGLGEKGDLLPDDEIIRGGEEIRWAPGALDGVLGHHAGSNEAGEAANSVLESIRALTHTASDECAGLLYSLLLGQSTLAYVDQLLEAILASEDLDAERVHSIANWLATGAADREPIKCAIALLGVCQGGDNRDLLLTLGRHEEFTLFASVALQNNGDEPEHEDVNLEPSPLNWCPRRDSNPEPTDYESRNMSSDAFGCVSADADLFKISSSTLFLCAAEVS